MVNNLQRIIHTSYRPDYNAAYMPDNNSVILVHNTLEEDFERLYEMTVRILQEFCPTRGYDMVKPRPLSGRPLYGKVERVEFRYELDLYNAPGRPRGSIKIRTQKSGLNSRKIFGLCPISRVEINRLAPRKNREESEALLDYLHMTRHIPIFEYSPKKGLKPKK